MRAFHDLAAHLYPFTITLLHVVTREELWSRTVQKPPAGARMALRIPGREELRVPVIVRIEFADGTVQEQAPESPAQVV